jgi:ABC-type amino acid transport substrate-binding protein
LILRGIAFSAALLASACGAAPASVGTSTPRSSPSLSASPTGSANDIAAIRARGILVVAVRVEAPPANRTMGDPAHAQKRAFETAVITLVADAVFGPGVRVQLLSQGGDRLNALGQADVAMVTEAPTSRDRALISRAYAANSVVVAVKDGGSITRIEDLGGKTVGVAQDELVTRDLAQLFFQGRGLAVTLDAYMGVNGGATSLDADRTVAFVGDGIGVAFVASERKLKVLAEVTPRPYVIAVRQSAPDLAAAVNAALADALRRGSITDAATKAGFPYSAP